MLLVGEEWQTFFDSMEREAFRLETLPVYRVPQEGEMIRRFLAGHPVTAADTEAWTERLKRLVSEGKTVSRVHVIRRPLTNYLRFEFEHYRHNVGAGEQIRILDLTDKPDPGLPDQDFWMLDESRVVLMHYEKDGTQASRELIEGDPSPYVKWKEIANSHSVPFLEYVKDFE